MTSQIDVTVPIFGSPTTASVRQNFLIASNEITELQNAAGLIIPLSVQNGGTGVTSLANNQVVLGSGTNPMRASSLMNDNGVQLSINNTGAVAGPALPGTGIQITANTGVTARITMDTYGGTSAITFRRANGVPGAPSATAQFDFIGTLNCQGYGTTGWSTAGHAAHVYLAAENWTDTAQGSFMRMATTPVGSLVNTNRVLIAQGVCIGNFQNNLPDLGQGTLIINSNSMATPPAPPAATVLQLIGIDSTATRLDIDAYGGTGFSGGIPTISLRRARGSGAGPSAVGVADLLGNVSFAGYGATNFGVARASLQAAASENWTDTAQGAYLQLSTTTPGTTTGNIQMLIAQGVVIGTPQITGLGYGTLALNANAIGTLPVAPPTGTQLYIAGVDSSSPRILFDGFAATPVFTFRRSNGTAAVPTAVTIGSNLGQFQWFGYGATGYSTQGRANVFAWAIENWTDTAQGAYMGIGTTPAGVATTPLLQMIVQQGVIIGQSGANPTSGISPLINYGFGSLILNPNPNSVPQVGPSGTVLHVTNVDGTGPRIVADSYGGIPVATLRTANGTQAAPTAMTTNQSLGIFNVMGRGATAYATVASGALSFVTAENWTDTAYGTFLRFQLVAPGSNITLPVMTLFRGLYIGAVSPADPGVGNIQVEGHGIQPGGGTWSAPSSRELKQDIEPYTQGLQAILALNPVSYRYKDEISLPSDKAFIGLVHDETSHMPELHGKFTMETGRKEVEKIHEDDLGYESEVGEFDSIDSGPIIYALINAVKELAAKLDIKAEPVEQAEPAEQAEPEDRRMKE